MPDEDSVFNPSPSAAEQAWLDATPQGDARTISHRVGDCSIEYTVRRQPKATPDLPPGWAIMPGQPDGAQRLCRIDATGRWVYVGCLSNRDAQLALAWDTFRGENPEWHAILAPMRGAS